MCFVSKTGNFLRAHILGIIKFFPWRERERERSSEIVIIALPIHLFFSWKMKTSSQEESLAPYMITA